MGCGSTSYVEDVYAASPVDRAACLWSVARPRWGWHGQRSGRLFEVRSGSPRVRTGRFEGVGGFPNDRFGEEHIRWNAAVPGIRHDRVKRLDDARVGRPETHVVSEVQVLVIGIPMTDENLTAVDNEDGSPSVPGFRVADIDLPTDDLRRGLILRRDPRRDTDGDSRLRAVPVRIDEEPAASDDAHLRRTHDHFFLSALDHLPELADDCLPLSEQEEIACGTRRGSRRDVGHEPRRTPLQVVFRRAQLLSAPLDEGLQGDRSVAKGLGRYDGNEAFRMEGFEDFVDPTPRYTGDARDLGRLRFPAFEQEQIDPSFVRTQPDRDRQLESIGLAPRTLRERLAHLNLPYGPSNIKLTPPRSSVRESLPEPPVCSTEEIEPRSECETLGIEHVCPASPRRLAWTDYRPAEPETWVRIPAGASSSRPRRAISESVVSIMDGVETLSTFGSFVGTKTSIRYQVVSNEHGFFDSSEGLSLGLSAALDGLHPRTGPPRGGPDSERTARGSEPRQGDHPAPCPEEDRTSGDGRVPSGDRPRPRPVLVPDLGLGRTPAHMGRGGRSGPRRRCLFRCHSLDCRGSGPVDRPRHHDRDGGPEPPSPAKRNPPGERTRRTVSTLRAMVRGEIASPSVDVRGRGHCGGFGPVSFRPLQAEGRLTSARGGRGSPGDTCQSRRRGPTSRAPVVPPSC